jgi:hypothetical protein
MNELLLYQKLYDFLVWIFGKTDKFPRSKRFSLGGRLENLLLDMVVEAQKLQYTKDRFRLITAMSASFDEVKLFLKISNDTKMISAESFAYALERCTEIGAMIGGYRKSVTQASSRE